MNIWILNHYAVPPDVPGITRHYDFSRELQKRGCKVTIFAASFNHRTRQEERLRGSQLYRKETVGGVDFVWVRTTPYYKGNDWRRTLNMLSYAVGVILPGISAKPKPDVIMASSPHPFSGLAAYFLAKIRGARFVFEVRDLWPETLIEIGGYNRNSFIVRILKALEKFLYKRASRIIVLLPKMPDYITKLGINREKAVYIPNGVSPDMFEDTHLPLPEEIKSLVIKLKKEGKTILAYTGAHGVVNKLNTLIETMRLLKEKGYNKAHLIMVGSGAEKPGLLAMANKWRLDNVSFFEPIPKNNIPELLKALDIGVIATKKSALYQYGTSINKLYDFMAANLPVILAADVAENPVLAADCGIVVPPEDPKVMAQAVIQLIGMNQAARRKMAQRGYNYVMKNHSIPKLAERLLEALKTV